MTQQRNPVCYADGDDDSDYYDETMLAVVSAEEYAAKIIKLQQACLTPLKEDLADWLNKILGSTKITADNFMDKLDNGVIICKLAKIISSWCENQFKLSEATNENTSQVDTIKTTVFTAKEPSVNTVSTHSNVSRICTYIYRMRIKNFSVQYILLYSSLSLSIISA